MITARDGKQYKSEIFLYDFNCVYFKIEGEMATLKLIQTFFEWEHPDKYMVQNYRNQYGSWNGMVKLFKLNDMLFPIGFFTRLKKICKNLGIFINISKKAFEPLINRKIDMEKLPDEILGYYDKECLDKWGGNIYKHQMEASLIGLKKKRGVFNIHTRGGKSVIIFNFLMWMYKNFKPDEKIVLIVPRIHLCEQMYGDFAEYTHDEGFLKWISVFYSGSESKDINQQIQITTYQSFIKNTHVYRDVKAVLVDEVQSADNDTLQTILDSTVNADWRFGFSGTVPDDELTRWKIISKLGDVIYEKMLNDSIREGIVSDFYINSVIIDYMDDDTLFENVESDFPNMVANLSEYEERPYITEALIRDGLIKPNAKIFQTFNRKISNKNFKKHHEEKFKDFDLYKFDGDVSIKRREKVRKLISDTPSDKGAICQGTLSVMNSGITIPNLDTVMFCDSSKKATTIEQAIGRSVGLDRNNPNKMATIIEVVDYIFRKRKQGHTIKQFISRMKLFKLRQFKQKFHYYKWFPEAKEFRKMDIPNNIQKLIEKYS